MRTLAMETWCRLIATPRLTARKPWVWCAHRHWKKQLPLDSEVMFSEISNWLRRTIPRRCFVGRQGAHMQVRTTGCTLSAACYWLFVTGGVFAARYRLDRHQLLAISWSLHAARYRLLTISHSPSISRSLSASRYQLLATSCSLILAMCCWL